MHKLIRINSKLFPDRYLQYTDFVASYGALELAEDGPILYLDPRYITSAQDVGKTCKPLHELPYENCVLDPFEWSIQDLMSFGFISPVFEYTQKPEFSAPSAASVAILQAFAAKNDCEYFYNGFLFSGADMRTVINLDEINLRSAKFDPSITFAFYLSHLDLVNAVDDPLKINEAILSPQDQPRYKQFAKKDAAAWVKFWEYIESNWQGKTEAMLSAKLDEFKFDLHGAYEQAFETILSNNENSCYIHARATEKEILPGAILIDAGTKIDGCISDITRVFLIEQASEQIKEAYTKVLQAFIAIAQGKFGTVNEIDSLARKYTVFAHATGHGVGAEKVHAYPVISGSEKIVKLVEHTLLAIEPGFYNTKDAKFGIRLEAEFLVKNDGTLECLTFIPFEYDLINFDMLNTDEQQWLSNFHKICYEELVEYCPQHFSKAFLLKKCGL